jgi:CheY-like chemotaxis protein
LSKRILVIDDSDDILDLYCHILEPEGYEIQTSSSIYQHLEEVERVHPDLVILDFKMGAHHDGWHFLQLLKMHDSTARIPVLLCTAAVYEVRKQEDYLRTKGIPILDKPFDIDDLVQNVRHLVEKKEAGIGNNFSWPQ